MKHFLSRESTFLFFLLFVLSFTNAKFILLENVKGKEKKLEALHVGKVKPEHTQFRFDFEDCEVKLHAPHMRAIKTRKWRKKIENVKVK